MKTEDLIKRGAAAISELDRVTPRPLAPEDQARAVVTTLMVKEMRDVLEEVAKRADFSQCPGLEDAVDFVLSGLPNAKLRDAGERGVDNTETQSRRSLQRRVRTIPMAIKVIKAPLDKRAVKRTPCMNCGATLEYTRSDTTERMVRDYTGDGDLCRCIKCPKCNHEIQVS